MASNLKEKAHLNIDQKKYRENYEHIFGKDTVKEMLKSAPLGDYDLKFEQAVARATKGRGDKIKGLERDNAALELMLNEASTRANEKQLEVIKLKAKVHWADTKMAELEKEISNLTANKE